MSRCMSSKYAVVPLPPSGSQGGGTVKLLGNGDMHRGSWGSQGWVAGLAGPGVVGVGDEGPT